MADASTDLNFSELAGQHAFVTGGSRGIGAACANALAAQGATVTVLGRDVESLKTQVDHMAATYGLGSGPGSGYVCADASNATALAEAIGQAADTRGPVSLLINNAGGAQSAPLERLDLANWNATLALNLTSAYVGIRTVIPDMKAANFGRIVNIASTAALTGYAYVSAYCAAKHGLLGLTRAAAIELAETGITVNAVCPGYTETDMARETVDRIVATTKHDIASARKELVSHNPQGRMIEPKEIADAVVFLCRPAAASITGIALPIAGGEV